MYGNVLYVGGTVSSKNSYGYSVIADSIFDENEFDNILSSKRLCIKVKSSQKDIIRSTAEIIRQYSGENEVCFYLTDLKKYLRLKDFNKISIKDDVLDKLCEILNVNDIGLIN